MIVTMLCRHPGCDVRTPTLYAGTGNENHYCAAHRTRDLQAATHLPLLVELLTQRPSPTCDNCGATKHVHSTDRGSFCATCTCAHRGGAKFHDDGCREAECGNCGEVGCDGVPCARCEYCGENQPDEYEDGFCCDVCRRAYAADMDEGRREDFEGDCR